MASSKITRALLARAEASTLIAGGDASGTSKSKPSSKKKVLKRAALLASKKKQKPALQIARDAEKKRDQTERNIRILSRKEPKAARDLMFKVKSF